MNYALLSSYNDYKNSPENRLRGCNYDATNVFNLLLEFGWPAENMIRLKDSDGSKERELRYLKELVAQLRAGDKLMWWHSAHGVPIPDVDGDEGDGFDEAICVYDSMEDWPRNLITDDEISRILAEAPRGAKVIGGFDTCFSATMTKNFTPPGVYRKAKLLDTSALGLAPEYLSATRGRRIGRSMADVAISGCAANQTSADTFEDGNAQGAMTWAFTKAQRANPLWSLADVHAEAVKILKAGGYAQDSQFETADEGGALVGLRD